MKGVKRQARKICNNNFIMLIIGMDDDQKWLDFSDGDPLYPLTRVANYAFAQSRHGIHKYKFSATDMASFTGKILCKITPYFTAKKQYAVGQSGLSNTDVLMTNGVTEGYELTIRLLATDFQKRMEREKTGTIPVIIMPSPTYGFFLENAQAHGIEAFYIRRDLSNGGRLDPEALKRAFDELNSQNKRVVAFYDSNPNNPCGLIRGREETLALAKIIDAQNKYYRERDWTEYHARQKTGVKGPRPDHWLSERVKIIDDLVYQGLEYEGSPQPFAFLQRDHEDCDDGDYEHWQDLNKDIITLAGISKAGLAGLRAGLVIAESHRVIHRLRHLQKMTSYIPTDIALNALGAYFDSKEPFASWREEHLKRMNAAHRFNGIFMKALIDGVNDSGASPSETGRMTRLFAKAAGIQAGTARSRLNKGIDGIRVLTRPEAGFFHLIDFSALRGTQYFKNYGMAEFNDSWGIHHLANQANIKFASSSWMGLDVEDMIVRATFAKKPEDIVELAQRLRGIVRELSPTRPVAQPKAA